MPHGSRIIAACLGSQHSKSKEELLVAMTSPGQHSINTSALDTTSRNNLEGLRENKMFNTIDDRQGKPLINI